MLAIETNLSNLKLKKQMKNKMNFSSDENAFFYDVLK